MLSPFFVTSTSPFETISIIEFFKLELISKIYSSRFLVNNGSQKPVKENLPLKSMLFKSSIKWFYNFSLD